MANQVVMMAERVAQMQLSTHTLLGYFGTPPFSPIWQSAIQN
jgi:hypothetical protein